MIDPSIRPWRQQSPRPGPQGDREISPMNIAYTTTFDIRHPGSWPKAHRGLYGASVKVTQLLAKSSSLEYLGPLARKRSPVTRLKWQVYRDLFKQDFYRWADPIILRDYAQQIQRKLAASDADLFLCPENAIPLGLFKPDRPTVLWTDTTIGSLIDFYPYLCNLCPETRRNILRLERHALEQCSLIIFNSPWAARTATRLYGISPDKIKVINRVSNLPQTVTKENIDQVVEQRRDRPCQLLFVGVDWQRKGGKVALEIAQNLTARGIEVELHIVGCNPPVETPDYVKCHGFIDTATAAGRDRMAELFQTSHFLIFPTRAEAYGIVLSEAAAFAVPALATDVGGIASVLQSDLTGQVFKLNENPKAYSDYIASYLADFEQYRSFAHRAFSHYQQNMSSSVASQRAQQAFQALLPSLAQTGDPTATEDLIAC